MKMMINIHGHILSAWLKSFVLTITLNPHNILMMLILSLSPFNRWMLGLQGVRTLAGVTKLVP